MQRQLLALFLFLFINLDARIQDSLKKAADKKMTAQVRNVDFIYMINLDERPEKYQASLQELTPYGITPYRFSAVNGWELSLEALNDCGVTYEPWMEKKLWGTSYLLQDHGQASHEVMSVPGKKYFCHTMSKGAVGIVLSHMSVLQDAYDCGFETIWVMEDDIEVIQNPHLISTYIDELDAVAGSDGWDILFTDFDTKGQSGDYVPCASYARKPNYCPPCPLHFTMHKNITPHLRTVGARYGAYSMIVRRSGMKKILDFIKTYQIFLPFDMEYPQVPGIRLFTVRQDIVSTLPRALSDNGAPNYQLQKSAPDAMA